MLHMNVAPFNFIDFLLPGAMSGAVFLVIYLLSIVVRPTGKKNQTDWFNSISFPMLALLLLAFAVARGFSKGSFMSMPWLEQIVVTLKYLLAVGLITVSYRLISPSEMSHPWRVGIGALLFLGLSAAQNMYFNAPVGLTWRGRMLDPGYFYSILWTVAIMLLSAMTERALRQSASSTEQPLAE